MPPPLPPESPAARHHPLPPHPFCLPSCPPAGYHLGVLNTCEAHVEVDIGSGEAGASLVASLLVGAALGSLGVGRLADRLGPR